jgi:hypothetical protein
MSKFSGYRGNEVRALKSSKLMNLIALESRVSLLSWRSVSSLADSWRDSLAFCGVDVPDPMAMVREAARE